MTSKCSIRIGLVEDHKLVREGLKALLKSEPSFELVGEASDGLEALTMVENIRPDVLLLDLRLPRVHGLEVLRQLGTQKQTHVVIVSMHSDEPYIVQALRNGVSAYVLKDCSPSRIDRSDPNCRRRWTVTYANPFENLHFRLVLIA